MGKLVVGCLADTMGSVFSGWFYMSAEGWFFWAGEAYFFGGGLSVACGVLPG